MLPEFAKDNSFIITTRNYLPKGSLLDIIVGNNISHFEYESNNHTNISEYLKSDIINLLVMFGLIPNSITEASLTCNDLDWNGSLSENEKIIIAITKALINPTPFIVMCGVASNVRITSQQYKLLDIVKSKLSGKKQFALIYTDNDMNNPSIEQMPTQSLSFVEEVVECIGQDKPSDLI